MSDTVRGRYCYCYCHSLPPARPEPLEKHNDASGLSEDPVGRCAHAEEAALAVLPERVVTSSLASR